MNGDEQPQRPGSSLRAALDARNQRPVPAAVEPPKAETESFKTPEEVAATDDIKQPAELVKQVNADLPVDSTKQPASWRSKLNPHFSWPPGKKEYIAIAAAVLLIGGITAALVLAHHSKPVPAKHKAHVIVKKKPTTVPSNLTGLPVAPFINQRPVTAVMIENSLDARPQSGLSQAGVVFEAVAEGGVTRFVALFQDASNVNVGPVRSARPYYIDWMSGFDASYAHVGGSPNALADIRNWNVKDLDEFANGGSYHRVGSRAAPHNVYTNVSTLNQLEASKGYGTSHYTSLLRKKDAPAKTVTAGSINFTMSGPDYNVHYDYNTKTNTYERSEAGAAHIDANTSKQINPNVVIAIVVAKAQGALDASGAYYSDYQDIGSGIAYIFQDGILTTGNWHKASRTNQISFTVGGQPIRLNAGQTWITAVDSTSAVSSSP
ncbi:MAG TPA: DUF3048 domain-containing protein [Candidatus Saccharimonadales bacterium]|nr:DUF3048 domain-containing protein [Candidatus Saccharimonadales bacterium]